jgi:predicted PurR-regulated permease PerM
MVEFNPGWLFVLAGLAIIALILSPFFTAIAFAAIAAFFWHPVHFKLRKYLRENGSAALLTVITAALFAIVMSIGASVILSEFDKIYALFSTLNFANVLGSSSGLTTSFQDVAKFVLTKIFGDLSTIATKLPHIILSMLMFFVTMFFFIRDGERLANWVKKNIPVGAQKKEKIFADLNNYAHTFINVWLLIGILQFAVAVVGFLIFGLPYALLAGVVAAILSIIPLIHTYALYIPVGIVLILRGDVSTGLGILIYGLTLGSIFDYGLRTYLASRWAAVHPLVILLGVLGGVTVLGPAGFIIGPMLLMIVIAFFKDYGLLESLK